MNDVRELAKAQEPASTEAVSRQLPLVGLYPAAPLYCTPLVERETLREAPALPDRTASLPKPGYPLTSHRGLLILPDHFSSQPDWQRVPPADYWSLQRLLSSWAQGQLDPPSSLAIIAVGVGEPCLEDSDFAEWIRPYIREPGFSVNISKTRELVVLPETSLFGGYQAAKRIVENAPRGTLARTGLAAATLEGTSAEALLRQAEASLAEAFGTFSLISCLQLEGEGVALLPCASGEHIGLSRFPELRTLSQQPSFRNALKAFSLECKRFPWFSLNESIQTADLASRFARALGFSDAQRDTLRIAGIFHDSGMLRIPGVLLCGTNLPAVVGPLLRAHPLDSEKYAERYGFSQSVRMTIRTHHERVDGEGYPDGLTHSQIPEEAKVLAIIDTYIAMRSKRSWRPPSKLDDILATIRDRSGTYFDDTLVDEFLRFAHSKEGTRYIQRKPVV